MVHPRSSPSRKQESTVRRQLLRSAEIEGAADGEQEAAQQQEQNTGWLSDTIGAWLQKKLDADDAAP